MLTDAQLKTLADYIVAGLAARAGGGEIPAAAINALVPRRLTAVEFGICIDRTPEVVKRRIRSRFIAKEHVEGRQGALFRLDRAALAKFNVTLEVAAERLAAWRARQSEAERRVQSLAPVPERSVA